MSMRLSTQMVPCIEVKSAQFRKQPIQTIWLVHATVSASKFGLTAPNTKATGTTIERRAVAASGMQTAINLKATLSMINQMAMGLTHAKMAQFTLACGSTMFNMARDRPCGQTEALLSAITKKEKKMDLVTIPGPREISTKANGRRT